MEQQDQEYFNEYKSPQIEDDNSELIHQLSEEIKEQDLTKSQDNIEKSKQNDPAIESLTSQQQSSQLDSEKPKKLSKINNNSFEKPKNQKIVKECAGPMLSGLGQKKQKPAQQQQATQSIQQQLQNDLINTNNLQEGQDIQTMKIQQDQGFDESSNLDKSDEEMNAFFEVLSTIKPVRIIKKNEDKLPQQNQDSENEKEEENLPTVLEEDIPALVSELAQKGFAQLIQQQQLTEAIIDLRRAENIISSYLFSDGSLKQNLVLFTLINLGVGYYRIGFLEESLVCLENCLVSLKNPSEETKLPSNCQEKKKDPSVFNSQNNFFNELPKRLAFKRMRCGLHMQCCIILSEMRRHEDALIHSRLASRLAYKILVDTMILVLVFYILSYYNPKLHKELEQSLHSQSTTIIEDKLQEIPRQKLNQRNNKESINNQQLGNQGKRAISKTSMRPRTSYSPNNQQLIQQTVSGNGNLPIMPRFESGNRNNKQRNIKKMPKSSNNNNNNNNKQFDLDIQQIRVQKRNNENQDQIINKNAQQQQQYEVQQKNENSSELQFLSNWKTFAHRDLLHLFQQQPTQWETNDFKDYIIKLVSIIFELKNRIINNLQDLAIGHYKAEEILDLLYKFVEGINDQNFLEQEKNAQSSFPIQLIEQADLKTIFQDTNEQTPLFTSSILALLQLQPKSMNEISKIMTLKEEISPDQILQKVFFFILIIYSKISNFAISLYCSSTETRFLEDEHLIAYLNPHQLLDSYKLIFTQNFLSEILLGKSLEIVYTFLRSEMIFVSQILVIYQRFHGNSLQPIVFFILNILFLQPEDEEMQEKYVAIRPLKGGLTRVQQPAFMPIIRMPAKCQITSILLSFDSK